MLDQRIFREKLFYLIENTCAILIDPLQKLIHFNQSIYCMKNHAIYESLLNILQLPSFSNQYTSIYLLMTYKRLKLKNGFYVVKKKKKLY